MGPVPSPAAAVAGSNPRTMPVGSPYFPTTACPRCAITGRAMSPHFRRIALWSGPRNLSTALMRAFSSRGDSVVSDEPFYAAYLARTGLDHPARQDVMAAQPTDWRVVAEYVSRGPAPADRPVWYQKHMAQHMTEDMLGDWLFALDHAFLIRHPGRVIASYLKVAPDMDLAETGLSWQVRLLDLIRETTGRTPPVIRSDDLRTQPEATLRALCEALDLAWDPAMLHWPVGRHPQDGVWATHWYANTWSTTGFVTSLTPEDKPPPPDVSFLDEAIDLYRQLDAHTIAPLR